MAARKATGLRKRVGDLREEIRHHDHLYCVLDRPEVSDEADAALFEQLKSLETARLLVDEGLVRELPDLFDLEPSQLEHLPGFAERSDGEELAAVPGIGPRIAAGVRAFFRGRRNRRIVDRLLDGRVTLTKQRRAKGGAPEGLTFAITGTLEGCSRRELSDLLERHGARVSGSVSRATDDLVVGEGAGSKLDTAETPGVPRLGERTLVSLLKRKGVRVRARGGRRKLRGRSPGVRP